jgi:hypothetical protein
MKRRTGVFSLAVPLTVAVGLALVGGPPANAAEIQLNSNAPHLCVAVENSDTANGTPVIAYSCSGGPNDRWNYINGQFQGIGTDAESSMCLDVKGQGTASGTLVDLWPCNGQQNQQWEIINGSLIGVQSGKCLDSSGGPSVGGGTQLVINTCNGSASSQNWILRGVQFELDTAPPYLCAASEGGGIANGTPVISFSCSDGPGQLWNFWGASLQGIGTNNGNSTCLTASGLTVGSLVTLSSCVASLVTQEWNAYNGAILGRSSANEIVLAPSGLCLDSSGGPSVGGGTQLVINPCNGGNSQNWNLR